MQVHFVGSDSVYSCREQLPRRNLVSATSLARNECVVFVVLVNGWYCGVEMSTFIAGIPAYCHFFVQKSVAIS